MEKNIYLKEWAKEGDKVRLTYHDGTVIYVKADRFGEHINLTVAQLISILQQLPQEAKITICGDDYCYIHVETDNTAVNLDNEPLDDNYENS